MPDMNFVPPSILEKLANLKPYILMLLKKGPLYNSPDAQKIIQSEHLPYLFKLREEGIVAISIPVRNNTDIAAITVYTITGKDDIKKIADEDPGVKKGLFVYELLNCIGMKGDTLT